MRQLSSTKQTQITKAHLGFRNAFKEKYCPGPCSRNCHCQVNRRWAGLVSVDMYSITIASLKETIQLEYIP